MPLFDISNLSYWMLLGMGVALFLFVIASGGGDRAPNRITKSSGIQHF